MAAHWNALLKSDKTITCIFFLDVIRTLVFLRTYKSAQMVEVLLMNRFPRSIVSDSKGLTAGKWVLSRGSLHSSSCSGINFLSLHTLLYLLYAAEKRALVHISLSCKKLVMDTIRNASLCKLLESKVSVILEKRT